MATSSASSVGRCSEFFCVVVLTLELEQERLGKSQNYRKKKKSSVLNLFCVIFADWHQNDTMPAISELTYGTRSPAKLYCRHVYVSDITNPVLISTQRTGWSPLWIMEHLKALEYDDQSVSKIM